MLVTPYSPGADFHPPQQARSRAALEKLLAAAEDVLVSRGLDDFTIGSVAEQAGVSVGGVYRRFASKEQLIDAVIESLLVRFEATISEALSVAEPSLAGVVAAFSQAVATAFTQNGQVASVLAPLQRNAEAKQRALHAVSAVQRHFLDAAAPYSDQVARTARSTALSTVLRTILAAGAHRSAVIDWWPDGLSWTLWAHETAAMATTYLTTPEQV